MALELVRDSFAGVRPLDPTLPWESENSFWTSFELLACLLNLQTRSAGSAFSTHLRGTDLASQQVRRANTIDQELQQHSSFHASKTQLSSERTDGGFVPALIKVAAAYRLSADETHLLSLMTINLCHIKPVSRALLYETNSDLPSSLTLYNIPQLVVEEFLDDKRAHVKDGLILLDNRYDATSDPQFKLTVAAARAIRGLPLQSTDRLKLAGTKLADVLDLTMNGSSGRAMSNSADGLADQHIGDDDDEPHQGSDAEDCDAMSGSGDADDGELRTLLQSVAATQAKVAAAHQELSNSAPKSPASGEDAADAALQPYEDSLAYMEDQFERIMQFIKLSKASISQDLQELNEASYWDRGNAPKHVNTHEFHATLKAIDAKIALRLKMTSDAGHQLPRLELLRTTLKLQPFECDVLALLTGHLLSPVIGKALASDDGMRSLKVDAIIHTFSVRFQDQIFYRKYFHKSSSLVRRGMINVLSLHWDRSNTPYVLIDRRLCDWLVGLDTDISEINEGLNLYTPTADLDAVILPEGTKESILEQVSQHAKFQRYLRRHKLDASPTTTSGLVLLFYGPSGTGKTLMVNAVAKSMKKKVLLINFADMLAHSAEKKGSLSQALFREADMSNAVVFFDECESMFAKRESGGSNILTELLTEIERYPGVVFLATNRAQDLDEAMYRRIHAVYNFSRPSHLQRRLIWNIHTEPEGIQVAADVDWAEISFKYDLSGGFIKNAVGSALGMAIARDGEEAPVIQAEDIHRACRLQMRGHMAMDSFVELRVPKSGLSNVVLTPQQEREVEELILLEKARSVLFADWGFGEAQRHLQSTTALFWGRIGTGKSVLAEAVGFELGRPIKLINVAELLRNASGFQISSSKSKAKKSVLAQAFADAAMANAVIVLDNFGALLSVVGERHLEADALMQDVLFQVQSYEGMVFVLVTSSSAFSSVAHRFESDLFATFKAIVEFDIPPADIRERLWQKLIPDPVPGKQTLDWSQLARAHDLSGGQISGIVYRTCAKVALKPDGQLTTSTLIEECTREKERGAGALGLVMKHLFL
ncbi:uncharacterized protein MONBRDRAFT_31207 [Monosiga brevicollis MX1]|uniref:AAA+ ATPase domain-containing protein n=1 Tax=Monosiga brevicollis TaxID=81824 RepID=A9USD6_MONBE|nr:uncharacterized protein MONBRDRAFT_31207 [Monosiga brevicollis MX1]EDQ91762.1 predicted protein [Monosiga brevicollis MX1]|eukprot:XP_001743048.1 hypothetical protein [Monosiga brevicollis MX1]